jgi:cellobiose phosphorylase
MHSAPQSTPLHPLLGPVPSARFLSSESYAVLITAAGTGVSATPTHALTPWRADRTEDRDGLFVYLRDLDSRAFWSAGLRPVPRPDCGASARWQPGRFVLSRLDDGIEATLEVCVAPDAAAEIRRLVLVNRSGRPRRIEVTTFAEVALDDPAAHAAHPSFSKLFVQTERVEAQQALLATRRPRSPSERQPWMIHALLATGEGRAEAQSGGRGAAADGLAAREQGHETDRGRFLGRCAPVDAPRALTTDLPLSGTTGNVLDPCVSLRRVLRLEPGARAELAFLLGAAPDRSAALALVERFEHRGAIAAAFEGAQARERELLGRLDVTEAQAESFQELAGAMLYGHPGLRASPAVLARARGSTADLARYGISPRRALAVVHAERPAGAARLRELVNAHRYWQAHRLPIDLLVLSDGEPPRISSAAADQVTPPLVVRAADLPPADLDLIDTFARLVVADTAWDLGACDALPATAVPRAGGATAGAAIASRATVGPATAKPATAAAATAPLEELRFANGLGGFTAGGEEYVIRLRRDASGSFAYPPRPWTNVIANETFGFIVSETGAGTTWSRNSREHRLTPWSNDPLLDPHGEAFYVRDEETGAFWSPLPGPAPAAGDYEMRHGLGASCCRHESAGLEQETVLFVLHDAPVRVTRLRLTDRSGHARRLSLFAYYRLALGGLPQESGRFVVTELDLASQAVLARNRLAGEFADGITFAAVVGPGPAQRAGGLEAPEGASGTARLQSVHASGDRYAFLGGGGSPADPAALRAGATLDGHVGAGLDPCVAQQAVLELPAGGSVEVCFLLGEARELDEARALIARLRAPGAAAAALEEARAFWQRGVSGVRIETPSPALDVMVNGWLPYQVLSCRIWGRSALYQSGGAFGFRDQLQDAGALVYLWPQRVRTQLLLHAAHQFAEGDVLHWWHPPAGRGLRTRFADDLLWLPSLTAFYVRTTGDWSVLEERVRFLAARALRDGEDEAFLQPEDSGTSADLYEHCCRAIDRSLRTGHHGLPLFGTGDWNDGMNRVGREGKGESVWMGFFLCSILEEFMPLCERRGDRGRIAAYRTHRERLQVALNDGGWDGEWYRRGYYDNGAPLGSHQSDECRIDALAQAWAVLSGVAPPKRARQAMDAVERHLIAEPDGLIRLLTPPFSHTRNDPGYIKGYVAGVRENGGQYTHAALWVVRALAEIGRHDQAARLLEMLTPIHHAQTAQQVAVYQVEPYVVAADVYGEPPHVGRGGWTWYTGSAGWMYRVALETLLGLTLAGGDALRVRPRIPRDWPQFTLGYRVPGGLGVPDRLDARREPGGPAAPGGSRVPGSGGDTVYDIRVTNPQRAPERVVAVTLDKAIGRIEGGAAHIPLVHDGRTHQVEIVLGRSESGPA